MKRAMIKLDKCLNCALCEPLARCPMKAVFRECPEDKPWVDLYKCSGCMKCKQLCPNGAFEMITQPCSTHGKTTW